MSFVGSFFSYIITYSLIFPSLFKACRLAYIFKYRHRKQSTFSSLHYVQLSSLWCNLFECPREFWGCGSSTGMPFILGTRTFGNSTKNGGPAIDVPHLGSLNDPTVHRWKVTFVYTYWYCRILSVHYYNVNLFHQYLYTIMVHAVAQLVDALHYK